jgi:hypothetical protein
MKFAGQLLDNPSRHTLKFVPVSYQITDPSLDCQQLAMPIFKDYELIEPNHEPRSEFHRHGSSCLDLIVVIAP